MLSENKEAWHLWTVCNTQWIAGGFGVIGLNYQTVMEMAKLYMIEITPNLMAKIRILEREYLKKINEKGNKEEQQ